MPMNGLPIEPPHRAVTLIRVSRGPRREKRGDERRVGPIKKTCRHSVMLCRNQQLPVVVGARIIEMRKKNYSIYDIRDELERTGSDRLGATAIQEVLREEGFSRLPRRLARLVAVAQAAVGQLHHDRQFALEQAVGVCLEQKRVVQLADVDEATSMLRWCAVRGGEGLARTLGRTAERSW